MGLWTQSESYLAASIVLQKHSRNEVSDPNYYLPAHALELALKAFLRGNGATLKCLRGIGHDLEICLGRAECFGLDSFCQMSNEDMAAIRLLNSYYKVKEFEYIVTGSKRYPPITTLQEIVSRLLQKIEKFCNANRKLCRD